GENSLAQCMNDIRKALGDDPNQPRFLRTIRGKGYSFIADIETAHAEPPVILEPQPAVVPANPRPVSPVVAAIATAAVLLVAVAAILRPSQKQQVWGE